MTMADITERFRFVEESLVYVDGPIEGFVVHLESGVRYAFRTREMVANQLCCWILLPVAEGPMTVDEVFASARANPPAQWLRGIEDRREGASKFELVEMTSDTTPPPIDGDGLDAVGPPGRDS